MPEWKKLMAFITLNEVRDAIVTEFRTRIVRMAGIINDLRSKAFTDRGREFRRLGFIRIGTILLLRFRREIILLNIN